MWNFKQGGCMQLDSKLSLNQTNPELIINMVPITLGNIQPIKMHTVVSAHKPAKPTNNPAATKSILVRGKEAEKIKEVVELKETKQHKSEHKLKNHQEELKSTSLEKPSEQLSLEVINKILKRFLEEKYTTRKEFGHEVTAEGIAQILGVTTRDLEKILWKKKVTPQLIAEIRMPLIKLYCATKFDKSSRKIK